MQSVAYTPQVSVLMPSLNQSEFIEAAARSVLGQNGVELELLISDGGSSDGTLEALERLTAEFGPRLRWVSSADDGPANAINRALQSAHGDIIGWLNADDVYASDAVRLAVRELRGNPELVMIYGEGEHIDGRGHPVGRYPTLPPSAGPQAFQAGCFICQPTVFVRRHVLDQIGALNETLSTAFDFDLWLRLFVHYPGRIGYLDRVQAYSRLHGRTITSLQRRAVASEAVQLLSKYLGHAGAHWILTYVNETVRTYPTYSESLDLRGHVSRMLAELASCFDEQSLLQLRSFLDQDKRLVTTAVGVHADLFPDGWAGGDLSVRIRSPLSGSFTLFLQCENTRPTPLELTIRTSSGTQFALGVARRRRFEISIAFCDVTAGQLLYAHVHSNSTFIPQLTERCSTDTRELAFQVSRIALVESNGVSQAAL